MAHSWLRLVSRGDIIFVIAGHALADEGKITVFAAASLTNAMQDIAAEYKKRKMWMWSPHSPPLQRWRAR